MQKLLEAFISIITKISPENNAILLIALASFIIIEILSLCIAIHNKIIIKT